MTVTKVEEVTVTDVTRDPMTYQLIKSGPELCYMPFC
jgi:hypothetical protein